MIVYVSKLLFLLPKDRLQLAFPSALILESVGRVAQPIFISVVTDEVLLRKMTTHPPHSVSLPILESVPSQGKANYDLSFGNRQSFYSHKQSFIHNRWSFHRTRVIIKQTDGKHLLRCTPSVFFRKLPSRSAIFSVYRSLCRSKAPCRYRQDGYLRTWD